MRITIYILFMFVHLFAVAQDTIVAPSVGNGSDALTIQSIKLNADSAYAKGNYPLAISLYEAILAGGDEAAAIYYNLGNSYYKNNEIAKAILNYERALLLNPGDTDTRFNLELAQSKTIDKVSQGYEIFFVQWYKSLVNTLNMSSWAFLGIVTFILLLIALLFLFFNSNVTVRKTAFPIAIIMLVATLFANIAAYHHYDNLTNRVEAVIIAPSVTAKSTPDESGTNLFVIHEGRKVKITDDSMKNWTEIELEDGTVGWVPALSLETI